MRVCLISLVAVVLALSFSRALTAPKEKKIVTVDFSTRRVPSDWRVTTKKWKIDQGELRGEGSGALEYKKKLKGDFTLSFDGWTEEKANIEIVLVDPKSKECFFCFAFLGSYHRVLDGVKSAILKGNRFVSVDPRMWIFPGRDFSFEVRRARNQYQMFLDGLAGPAFTDPDPEMEEFLLKISASTGDKKESVSLDNVRLVVEK